MLAARVTMRLIWVGTKSNTLDYPSGRSAPASGAPTGMGGPPLGGHGGLYFEHGKFTWARQAS